jgi:hypothetical protein
MNAPVTVAAIASMPRRSADLTICAVLADVLPPGSPPQYQRIERARFVGKLATADLVMFDGQSATIEAWEYLPGAWAHRWTRYDGGDACLENGVWARVARQEVPA